MNFPFYTDEPQKSPREKPIELPPSRQSIQVKMAEDQETAQHPAYC